VKLVHKFTFHESDDDEAATEGESTDIEGAEK
jgi:hypothetical protein